MADRRILDSNKNFVAPGVISQTGHVTYTSIPQKQRIVDGNGHLVAPGVITQSGHATVNTIKR
jgi:predicted amidohydrolase